MEFKFLQGSFQLEASTSWGTGLFVLLSFVTLSYVLKVITIDVYLAYKEGQARMTRSIDKSPTNKEDMLAKKSDPISTDNIATDTSDQASAHSPSAVTRPGSSSLERYTPLTVRTIRTELEPFFKLDDSSIQKQYQEESEAQRVLMDPSHSTSSTNTSTGTQTAEVFGAEKSEIPSSSMLDSSDSVETDTKQKKKDMATATVKDLHLKPVVAVYANEKVQKVFDILKLNGLVYLPVASTKSNKLAGVVMLASLTKGISSGKLTGSDEISDHVAYFNAGNNLGEISIFIVNENKVTRGDFALITEKTGLTELNQLLENCDTAIVTDEDMKPIHVVTTVDLLGYLVTD